VSNIYWATTNVRMNWFARMLLKVAIYSCWRDPQWKQWKQWKESNFRIFDKDLYGDGLSTLIMRDRSRAWFKDGKLYISEEQVANKLVLFRAPESEGDYELSGTGVQP